MNKLENNAVGELIRILEQETRVYDSISKIAKDKTKIIIEGKVNDLENIVKLEQSLVLQIGRLEDQRESIVEQCSKKLGLDISKLTISELHKHVDENDGEKLKKAQENMVGVLNGLKSSNELNSKLIKNSLDFISFSINLYADISGGNNNYESSGQSSETNKRSFFDVKL